MNGMTIAKARDLQVDDVLVNPTGQEFRVHRLRTVGRGIRVYWLPEGGREKFFTAAPEALLRVRQPLRH